MQEIFRNIIFAIKKIENIRRYFDSIFLMKIRCSIMESSSGIFHLRRNLALRQKCPNTGIFLVRNFPHSDWIRRDTEYLSVFNPNVGKYAVWVMMYFNRQSLKFPYISKDSTMVKQFHGNLHIFYSMKCSVKRSIQNHLRWKF